MSVEIFLLGGWDVQKDGKSLFTGCRRSQKNLELLKYFMGNRGKKLSSENIVESLWGDANLIDSQNTLRTQIFRLRQMLQEAGLYEKESSEGFFLSYESGFYIFTLGENCLIDTDRFEKNVREAETKHLIDPNSAIECYQRAVQLYKGDYLADNIDWTWAFPLRTRFRRLYIQSLLRLFELLKTQGRHVEIVEYFEQAMCYEPLEESLNLCYLDALLEMKEFRLALSHYNYITGRMYRELSQKPSSAMKNIYIKITAGEQNVRKAELWDLSKRIFECTESDGALYCGLDYFRTICNLEECRSLRHGTSSFLGLATISGGDVSAGQMKTAGQNLSSILKKSLRKGDVYTQWNSYQTLLLLTDAKPEGLIPIGSRIRKAFEISVGHGLITVNLEFKPIRGVPNDLLKKVLK